MAEACGSGFRPGPGRVPSCRPRKLLSFLDGSGPKRSLKWVNNRSVMPLDVPGRTRVTMGGKTSAHSYGLPHPREGVVTSRASPDWASPLQLSVFNEEFLVVVGSLARDECVPALCTHRPSLLPIELHGYASGGLGRPDSSGPLRAKV